MNNSVLTYQGRLEISTKTRTSVKHNHGTNHLFRLFTSILCKETFHTHNLPTYFMLYNTDTQALLSRPDVSTHTSSMLLRQYVDITSQSSSKDSIYQATFSSMIDSAMLAGKLPNYATAPLTLALVSGDKKSILAVVPFDNEQYGIVSSGGQAYIRWIMSLSNADDLTASAIANLLED